MDSKNYLPPRGKVENKSFFSFDNDEEISEMVSGKLSQTVLIVEDDIPTNKLFQYYLSSGLRGKSEFEGEIIAVYDGKQAVEQCRIHAPELIFMDLNLPVKDGISAIEEIRSSGFTNPIIVITNFARVATETCYKVGADVVMSKPVSKRGFIRQFKKFYKGSEKSTELTGGH